MKRVILRLISIITIVMMIGTAAAIPEMMDAFNIKYNTIGTRLNTCDTCHIPDKPQKRICDVCHVSGKPQKEETLNSYGLSIKDNLNIGFTKALSKMENVDSDKDGFTNIDEIRNLTFPGSKNDKPKKNGILIPFLNIYI